MTELEMVTAILGTLGGFELIKWLYRVFTNRKNDSRINDAEGDNAEFNVLKEQLNFANEMNKEKEMRFEDQTKRLRATQDELFETQKKLAQVELALQYEKSYRCEIRGCKKRLPPSDIM